MTPLVIRRQFVADYKGVLPGSILLARVYSCSPTNVSLGVRTLSLPLW
jgi:hypothetical protein